MELSDIDLRKRKWSPEEDQKLMAYIEKYGIWNWSHMPKAAGLSRSGKSCRLRWMNYLRPELKRDGGFTMEEIETIIKMHESLGNKWSMIAAKLPGRSDNEIKNFWQKHARKYCKSNPTVTEENYYRRKRFKHKQKRVTEVKSSLSYGEDESNLQNSSTITESTQFPIAESYSPTKDYDVAFAASDILENVSSSEICGGIQGNLISAQVCIEDVYLPEINSTNFEDASSTYPAHEWDVQEFPYASNNDELTSFWINIFLEANHLSGS